MFYFALFPPLSAKDRNAEGAGEVGEVDGPGVGGASGERGESRKRSPLESQSEQQNRR